MQMLRLNRLATALSCLVALWSTAAAQTVSVTDSVSTFGTFASVTGSVMSDPRWDQQTGQGADDFVGDGVGGYYGFYYKFGQVNGVDTLIFRFRFNVLELAQGVPKFTGNARMGVDGNGDGKVDLYFGVSTGAGQVPEIVFQNPTGGIGTNISPNTSSLGNVYGNTAKSASNYNYGAATDGSNYGTGNSNTANGDAFLTFAIPFSTFKTNLESQLSGVTITTGSFLRFVAFTSTQGNAVNQDVYGIGPLSTYGTVRYDQGGGFSNYYSATGTVIPEASTYVQLMLLLGAGVITARFRRAYRQRKCTHL